MPSASNVSDMQRLNLNASNEKQRKYFYYDASLHEETGFWIPVSIPPMSESGHQDWNRVFCDNGGYFPDCEMGWKQFIGQDRELTMWDVVVEILLVARARVTTLASRDVKNQGASWVSNHLLEEAWKEMDQTLTEAYFRKTREIL